MKTPFSSIRSVLALLVAIIQLYALPLHGQWTSTNLSQAKVQMGAAACGSRVYFAGGTLLGGVTNKVEIYDTDVKTWTNGSLSVARAFPGAATHSSKVFFAGGVDWSTLTHFANVDIFDTLTQLWTTATLSAARTYVQAVSAGSKVFFAGGYKVLGLSPPSFNFYSTVDVYDAETGAWSVVSLPQARAHMGVAANDNLVFFAGGQTAASKVSDRVDIYNLATNTWSMATLSEPRGFCAAASVGKYILIAGGVKNDNTQSDRVDIYNVETEQWSTASLSEARSFSTMGAAACSKAFFAGGGEMNLSTFMFEASSKKVDVFDAVTGQWSADNLPKATTNHSVIGLYNQILVAGGISGQVFLKSVDIFTCTETVGLGEPGQGELALDIYPNPASDHLRVQVHTDTPRALLMRLTDRNNAVLRESSGTSNETITLYINDLPAGLYLLEVWQNDAILAHKKVIKY